MLKRIILGFLVLVVANAQTGAVSRPSQWAIRDCERAVEVGLVPSRLQESWQEPITREAFCEMAMYLLSEQGLDLNAVDTTNYRFADTSAKHVLQAAALGVVKGTQSNTSGVWFSPDDYTPRSRCDAVSTAANRRPA